MQWKNEFKKYAITNYIIKKKINKNFVFPNTPPQLTHDISCLLILQVVRCCMQWASDPGTIRLVFMINLILVAGKNKS